MQMSCILLRLAPLLLAPLAARAGEGPFFVTYTHRMEEPGNLELAANGVTARSGEGNRFVGSALELEYGLAGWWTTGLYFDGQATRGDSAVFTGYRWENRFRLLPREHWINPVLYVEFENLSGADRTLLEVVNHDGKEDWNPPNSEARQERKHELEMKLILSRHAKGWTIAGNVIAEKNLGHAPWEFGYAAGVSRPLALAARPERCTFCPENFVAGLEMYGGLGTQAEFGLRGTSQYLAPSIAWAMSDGTTLRLSTGFGVTPASARFLLRFGVSYEVAQFGRAARRLMAFGGSR